MFMYIWIFLFSFLDFILNFLPIGFNISTAIHLAYYQK